MTARTLCITRDAPRYSSHFLIFTFSGEWDGCKFRLFTTPSCLPTPPLLMYRILRPVISVLALTMALVSCETPDYAGPGPRPAPRVLIPSGLSQDEVRFMPEIEDALIRAGYRPTRDRSAEYQLDFDVDDGPVNADTHLVLSHEGSEVARSYARVGGPRIILHRQEFIRQSFDKCLRDFESQLSRASGGGYGEWQRPSGSYRQTDRQVYEDRGYDRGGYDQDRYDTYGGPSQGGYERPY